MIFTYKDKMEACLAKIDTSLLEVHAILQTPVHEDSAEIRSIVKSLKRAKTSLIECIEVFEPNSQKQEDKTLSLPPSTSVLTDP